MYNIKRGETMLLLNRIKETTGLSDSELKIANYVNEFPQKVITMTIHELAEETYTSPSSITRFCRKVNTEGFTELKIQLAKEINTFNLSGKRIADDLPFNRYDDYNLIARNILNLNIQAKLDTYNSLDLDQLEKISKMIIEANGVHLYGKGQSLILCEDLQYKLFRIGIDTNLSSNTGFQVMKSGAQPQDSIAIMISYYGMGNENLFIAKSLYENNIPFILITGPKSNDLCQYATEIVHVPPQEELMRKMASFSSRSAIQLVIDIIYAYVFAYNYDENKKMLNR